MCEDIIEFCIGEESSKLYSKYDIKLLEKLIRGNFLESELKIIQLSSWGLGCGDIASLSHEATRVIKQKLTKSKADVSRFLTGLIDDSVDALGISIRLSRCYSSVGINTLEELRVHVGRGHIVGISSSSYLVLVSKLKEYDVAIREHTN